MNEICFEIVFFIAIIAGICLVKAFIALNQAINLAIAEYERLEKIMRINDKV